MTTIAYIHKDIATELAKLLGGIVAIIIIAMLFGWALVVGLGRQEIVDCMTWQSQAQQYPAFYLTPSQAAQCKAHNIEVNAPTHE